MAEGETVILEPGEARTFKLAGQPLAVLVTSKDSKHTCMFDWTGRLLYGGGADEHQDS